MAQIKIDYKSISNLKEELAKIRLAVPYEMRTKFRTAANIMKKDVKEMIERGGSPVKGQTRFVEYSERYKKAIKKGRYPGKKLMPINLTLSGRMLKSLAAKITSNGFTVYFTSALAKFHSIDGPRGNKEKVRKVVPTGNEKWRASVLTNARNFLKKETTKKVVSKLRRL